MSQHEQEFRPLPVGTGSISEADAPEMVIGRDELVSGLWSRVKAGSVRVLSERRMGKTWALKLAIARRPGWAVPLFYDVQPAEHAPQFVWELNKALHGSALVPDNWWNGISDWFRRVLQRIERKKIGPWDVPDLDPWDSLLETTCRHFADAVSGKTAVLMIDELPFFLDKLIEAGRQNEAIQTLDRLRAVRHAIPSLRMVFCGSLGLHIVLNKLHQAGYSGQPVNDMPPFAVPPLEAKDGRYLAGCLLLGQEIPCSNIGDVANAIAEASSQVPFYIHRMVSWMVDNPREEWTVRSAAQVRKQLYEAPGDPAEFNYYETRLDQHYPGDIAEKAKVVLDVLSSSKRGMDFDAMLNLVRHRPKHVEADAEGFLPLMRTLRDDHYIVEVKGRWRFKVEIVREWWYQSRGRLAL